MIPITQVKGCTQAHCPGHVSQPCEGLICRAEHWKVHIDRPQINHQPEATIFLGNQKSGAAELGAINQLPDSASAKVVVA